LHRLLPIVLTVAFFGVVGCEKVDQAFEAVEKAKALKTDIEQTADRMKKELTGKAEEIRGKALNELGPLPYLNEKGEEKPEGRGE
jgi:hypothetical protein